MGQMRPIMAVLRPIMAVFGSIEAIMAVFGSIEAITALLRPLPHPPHTPCPIPTTWPPTPLPHTRVHHYPHAGHGYTGHRCTTPLQRPWLVHQASFVLKTRSLTGLLMTIFGLTSKSDKTRLVCNRTLQN